jgi:hypothetical protein
MEETSMKNKGSRIAGLLAALVFCLVAVPDLLAASIEVTADTPVSFHATFKGADTDPYSIAGNDFQTFTFDFWTVLVNLRGDGVDASGNAFGFYEIQLTHTGSLVADPTAPLVNTFLLYGGLQPNVVLTDSMVSSQPHQAGSEYLMTTVQIRFDPSAGVTHLNGTIAGDSDLDGDGTTDSQQTHMLIEILQDLMQVGTITGREMGEIIRQTRQPGR